ncbi:hypothetical protein KJ612_06725 [Myxococcota bacterium]|nr:hypothetical protein [Myxococcota bacterium]MBU1413722.1 hypothetical protein [Myxococcota bacterium]
MKRLTSIFMVMALFAFVTACDDGDKKKTNNTNNVNCGDNVIDGTEVCDGTALGEATCVSEGFTGGTLGCLADCTDVDTSGCTNVTNNTTPGHVGDPCTATDQCVTPDATCYAEVGFGMPSGYCVAECDTEGACTEESSMCVSTSTASFCAKTCTLGGTDCRTGYECVDIGETMGICWANCTASTQCPTTGICDTEAGFCVTPPEVCDNTTDDDFDGDIDCDDADCAALPDCGCPEDDYENHDGGSAYTMDLSTIPADLDGFICGPANEDWFAITPATSFAGKVTLTFVNADGDLDMSLTDDAFEEVGSSAGVDDVEEIEYNFVGGSTYYIMVQGYAGAIGTYNLAVDYSPADIEADITATPANGTPGGTVALNVTLTNVGGLDASTVAAVLTSADADVAIVDGTAAFGNIAVAGTANNSADALSFTIAASHKNNLPVALTLDVTDADGGTWSFPVSVPVPFASLVVSNMAINDASGNNDGYADPAEDVNVTFDVENIGSLLATGPISVAVNVDASSTVTNAILTAPGNTQCTATDLAAGALAACTQWGLAVPAGAANGQTIVLNFIFTDGAANQWTEQKTITVGPASYASILTALDPAGDNGNYACDLRDVLAYVDASNVLNVKMTFHAACNLTGIHDVYLSDGTTLLTLTLEENAKAIWSTASGAWAATTNPASFTITPLSGSTSEVVYSIPVSAIPDLTLTGNSIEMFAAVIASWSEADYNDYAPDSPAGDMPWVTFTW